ncbi:hypothetical protein GCM10022204_11160 [Microlunatus aurantiacus]|uniref:SGNH hydrolase-type esterase domain-containing protein n=1 Tax=Microlunatus aurantiacus TaxID=446786 RepID=A0ABP7CYP5_9ACTN
MRRLVAVLGWVSVLVLVAAAVLVRLHGVEPTAAHRSTPPSATTPAATGPLHLLGFGDSVMAGAGCDCDDFLRRTGDLLERRTGRAVVTVNDSANGETAADLLGDLRTDDGFTAEIGAADVIVLTIGANDLGPALDDWVGDACERSCYDPEVRAMGSRLSAILAIVDREKRASATVFVVSYWNVFRDGDVGAGNYDRGYLAWSDQVTRDANTTICRTADLADATCVDLYAPFKGADGTKDPTPLLADDGDHPNDAGTALIATVVAAAVERRGSLG